MISIRILGRTIAGLSVFAALSGSVAWSDPATVDDVDIVWPSVGPQPIFETEGGPAAGAPDLPGAALNGLTPVSPGTPSIALGFQGPDAFSPIPPDTHIGVGTGTAAAGRVVIVTNAGLEIFDKTGTSLAGPLGLSAFLGSPLSGFDPKVLFDQHSGRFFITVLEGRTPNPGGDSNVHIAVSTTSTPTNLTTDWVKSSGSALTSIGGVETWFDYPGIGADANALFVTGNLFDSNDDYRGSKIRVFDKSDLMSGIYTYTDIDNDPGFGATLQPAHVTGTTDSGDFYLVNRVGSTTYRVWQVTGHPASPTLVGNGSRSWSAGSQVSAGAPQMGTSVTISTLSSRVLDAVYRDGHIWLVLSSDVDSDSKTEVFWAKIATNGGLPTAPTLADSGFIDGSDGDEWTFMPSIAANAAGQVVVGFSQSYSDQFPEMRYAGLLPSESAFFDSSVATTSVGFYDSFSTNDPDRWGDYSATVVDPDDDTTFWIANEFVHTSTPGSSRWGTFVARLNKFVCSNGALDAGETCDDGNLIAGDGCNPSCQIDECYSCIGEPSSCVPTPGASCDDGEFCTTDLCDGAGACIGTPNTGAPCDDGDLCTSPDVCSSSGVCDGSFPLSGCLLPDVPGKSRLKLKSNSGDKDVLLWKWLKGTTDIADFGDPTDSTDYRLCIYDAVDGALMSHEIPADNFSWKATRKGFKNKVPDLYPDGIKIVVLKEGVGKGKIIVKGKGNDLGMTPLGPPLDLPLTVQLTNGTTCWSTQFSTPSKNDAGQFKAKSD